MLSNFWIRDNKSIEWVYDRTLQAIDLVNKSIIDSLIKKYEDDIQHVINNNSIEGSIELSSNIQNYINTKLKIEK